jgi:hypothetical protein
MFNENLKEKILKIKTLTIDFQNITKTLVRIKAER